MAEVQEVLIDFKVDYSELTTAQEQLAKSGKIDDKGFAAVSKSISKTAADTKGLIQEFKKVATTATQMGKSVENAFGAGVQDALNEAGVSVDEFSAALVKANAPTKTLKAELRELKEALAQAKVNGKDVGIEFENMRARAGALADAIEDAGKEIKNAGSDTRNIDNVVGSISALAGGFAAVQGAAALFGDENEDLQKALLKVNGAMALASGLQQFYNATLKEGALTKLADSVATGVQTATQRIYTFVTGQATAATVAFKVALAATGIGLFVVGILALVSALDDTETSLEDVNRLLDQQNQLLESSTLLLARQTDIRLANAKAAGAAESDLIRIRAQAASNEFDLIEKVNKGLITERDAAKATSKQFFELNSLIEKNQARQSELNQLIKVANIEGRAALKDEAKERAKSAEVTNKKIKELRDKNAAEARAARLSDLQDELAKVEKLLLFAEKGSQEELDLKKKVIISKRNIDLDSEKLTIDKIRLIRAKAYKDQLDLQEAFNAKLTSDQLQAQIDSNNAILAGISRNNEERLQLQIENIATAAQLEINAAEGSTTKILLIEAKKIADIRALKNKAIDDDLAEQVAASAKTNNIIKTGLSRLADDYRHSAEIRIAALKAVERQELINVDRAIEANEKKEQSDEEYQANYKKLAEERVAIESETLLKIGEVNEQANEKRISDLKEIAQLSIEIAGQVADFFSNLNQLTADQDRERIEAQKSQLQSLVEAGAITAKQAEIRAKQIEVLERQAKQRQAQREKSIAVFNALLAIPSSVLRGLQQGGPVLAAIYGALAAAQAALVISRPVPKFFRGKKDNYEGPGMVADMGSELVERNGRMFLYTKPTETYLSSSDKVYTAAETRQIMHNTNVNTTVAGAKQERFDYDRLAKAIPKHSVAINIEKDFISEAVNEGLSKNNYFSKRYKF
jgi:hypothetical protein